MSLHTVSPGFKQYQTDLLPAARLPGKESSLDQNQPVTKKQGPYCGVLKWYFSLLKTLYANVNDTTNTRLNKKAGII